MTSVLKCTRCDVEKGEGEFHRSYSHAASHGRRMPCKECQRHSRAVIQARYYANNRDAVNERRVASPPEVERKRSARRYASDPVYRSRMRDSAKKHALEHPEYYREASKRRRALKFSPLPAKGALTQEAWNAIVWAFNETCAYCECVVELTQDHIIPLSRGGLHVVLNVVPACRTCNSKKYNRTLVEFFMRMPDGAYDGFVRRHALAIPRIALEVPLGVL